MQSTKFWEAKQLQSYNAHSLAKRKGTMAIAQSHKIKKTLTPRWKQNSGSNIALNV